MTYGKRPIRCHNCGTPLKRVYQGQTVCCVEYHGPRWIDDPQGAKEYRLYLEWFSRLPEDKTR